MSRITIFVGHYGSGKTEISINYAMKLREEGKEVIIVDLDIVNAFYRTKDAQDKLLKKGIEVISPPFANTNVDIPVLPQNILKAFSDKSKYVVFDVGGDDDGAIALGGYNRYFLQDDYEMLQVVNTKRPLTETAENIIINVKAIENKSRLKIAGLVNNTNLSFNTTIDDVLEGEEIVKKAASMLNVPFKFTSVKKDLLNDINNKTEEEVFPIDKYLLMPWQN